MTSLQHGEPQIGGAGAPDRLDDPTPEWIVTPSAEERARGQLAPQALREAHAAFANHGCLLLREALPVALIDAMREEFDARYGALGLAGMREQSRRPPPNPIDPRGEARFEITARMSGAFARPEGFASPLLRGILGPLLGADMQLNSFSIVVSYPGAQMQQIHRDHGHLFAASSPEIGPSLPVYAVNVGVPLIDVDLEIGVTGVWPGSHRWAPNVEADPAAVTVCPIKRGDCILIDYRTLHTGMPNRSARVRPIVYMVYARGWFTDEATHFGVNSPDLPLDEYNRLPDTARKPLLFRALSLAVRSQRGSDREASNPRASLNPADPASWGKVGRNDACPCGSGKKYKQCHGRTA
jgi:Phytanoyl-CoA dioxygenase (PhyH)/SEC-C motif